MRGIRPFVKWRFGARAAAALFGVTAAPEAEVGAAEAANRAFPDWLPGGDAHQAVDEFSLILYSDLSDVLRARRGDPVGEGVTDRQRAMSAPDGSRDRPGARRARRAPAAARTVNRRPCRRFSSLR